MAEQRQKPPWILILIYMGITGFILYVSLANRAPVTKPVSYSDFVAAIQDGKVEVVRVTNSELIGAMKTADSATEPASITTIHRCRSIQ